MAKYELNGIALELPDALAKGRIAAKLSSGEYEGHEARAAMARVKPGQRVLELGAGLGYIGSICAARAGAENIIMVEANPAMLPVIRANLNRNGAQDAQLLHGAVVGDDHEGETLLFRQGKQFWGAAIATVDDNPELIIEVPLLRISRLLKTHRPNVVIMDIEGAEQYLFDVPWPRHVRFVMMELHPRRYADGIIKRIVDCMSETGLTYDPQTSRGTILGFRRVRSIGDKG